MSIKERITDARILYSNGQREGALMSVLVAVAATSRKRYPMPCKDREAFTKFVGEEMKTITGAGGVLVKFREEMISLQELLYKFVRCELAHEAKLPEDIVFNLDDSLKLEVKDTQVIISTGLIHTLADAVIKARENAGIFDDV